MSEEVTETVQDTTEVAETVVEDVPAEVVDAFDIDALIAAEFGDDPVMSGEHKIGVPYQEVLKHIPENGRKVIQNLRSSYSRKTQELADLRRELEAERENLVRQQEMLTNSDWAKQVARKAADTTENDIWDTNGRQAEIERQAAIMMQKTLAPLQQELAQKQRQLELDRFKAENPDLKEYRIDIAKMLIERPELKLEDAYTLVKAKKVAAQKEEVAAQKKASRAESREGLYKTSNGKRVNSRGMKNPQFKDAWAAYQWHRSQQQKGS